VKGLKKENLRDNMTNLELVLNMLAEVTTTAISRSRQPETFAENRSIAIEGGNVAGSARREIEQRTGQSVVSPLNATDKLALDTNIEDVKQIESNDRTGKR
jgi:thiazole synthase ThiGH ThiG subunit